MEPFEEAAFSEEALSVEHWISKGLTREDAEKAVAGMVGQVFVNDLYQVHVRLWQWPDRSPADLWHLSIKRRDRETIHDWRELQEIKNALVGPEHEGVELYPAESRLVDSANQYHLWVLVEPGLRWPFGYTERLVQDVDEGYVVGAKQRPFNQKREA